MRQIGWAIRKEKGRSERRRRAGGFNDAIAKAIVGYKSAWFRLVDASCCGSDWDLASSEPGSPAAVRSMLEVLTPTGMIPCAGRHSNNTSNYADGLGTSRNSHLCKSDTGGTHRCKAHTRITIFPIEQYSSSDNTADVLHCNRQITLPPESMLDWSSRLRLIVLEAPRVAQLQRYKPFSGKCKRWRQPKNYWHWAALTSRWPGTNCGHCRFAGKSNICNGYGGHW